MKQNDSQHRAESMRNVKINENMRKGEIIKKESASRPQLWGDDDDDKQRTQERRRGRCQRQNRLSALIQPKHEDENSRRSSIE